MKMIFKQTLTGTNKVEELITEINKLKNLDDETLYNIRLVYSELYINIKEHSNATKIKLLASLKDDLLVINFSHNGKGFNHQKYVDVDVSSRQYLLKESGRGICIVKNISSKLYYNKKGNVVCAYIKVF